MKESGEFVSTSNDITHTTFETIDGSESQNGTPDLSTKDIFDQLKKASSKMGSWGAVDQCA